MMTLPIIRKEQEFGRRYEEFHLHHGQIRKLMEHPRGNMRQLKTILSAVQRLHKAIREELEFIHTGPHRDNTTYCILQNTRNLATLLKLLLSVL